MSATGRSNVRLIDDSYETPEWCVHRLLEQVYLGGAVWMDPCAGNGAIVRAVDQFRTPEESPALNKPHTWIMIEKREECRAPLRAREISPLGTVLIGDFLDRLGTARVALRHPDVIITNPPYSLAQEFIEESMSLAPVVAMLLRLNYLASESRASFMRDHTPDVYVLPNRPSFTGGGTDATEYAWMIWRRVGARQTIAVLNSTPVAERTNRVIRRGMSAPIVRGGMRLPACDAACLENRKYFGVHGPNCPHRLGGGE